eukprot:467125-Prymnesium_polylepis.2
MLCGRRRSADSLALARRTQDENMAPSRFELFHRGPGLEDPDESHVRERIIGQLYDFFRSNS